MNTEENNINIEEPNTNENKNEEIIYSKCEKYQIKWGYPAGASKIKKANAIYIMEGILPYNVKDRQQ